MMKIRTVNKRKRRREHSTPTFAAGRGIWFQPCDRGGTACINGHAQPQFYRSYRQGNRRRFT